MLRIILILLEVFLALTAFYGGWLLVARPDGSLLQLSLDMIARTPFKNYFFPGLVLMLLVGGSAFLAAILVMVKHNYARKFVLFSSLMLGGWIVGQLFLVGLVNPSLQFGYLTLSVALLLLGWSWRK